MKYPEFQEWLEKSKGISERSARDVVSRSKRVLTITKQSEINSRSMDILINSADFEECSMSIKSQLKRAVTLYLEFTH